MATEHRFHLPITTEAELKNFIRVAFGVHIPDVQVCPNHSTPWRAFCDAYFARSPVVVWKASRGFGGKSFLLALLGTTEAAALKADVNILGGSGEQSTRVHSHMHRFWLYDDAPRDLLASDPSKRETKLIWGNQVQALMASQASVRGPHPQRLRLDEVDEMDIEILDAALGQPMSKPGIPAQTVMSSTHQYADGTMTAILKRAAEKGWPVHQWCYKETMQGWLDPAEVERKRNEVTAVMFATEYDLQDPAPDSRAIQPDKVAQMFDRELGTYAGAPRQYIEIEPPQPGAKYATGADWARKQDWTIIITSRIDTTPRRIVAFERLGREAWPQMTARLDDRINRYGGRACHDGTGIGDVVASMLSSRWGAESVIMSGRTRSDMLTEYISAVERGEYEAPMIEYMENEHRLASVDDVYGEGHLPDTISAAALMHKAAVRKGVGLV
jgi:hypothetical protein